MPEYGPYMANEEKLQLFKDVRNKKVLELGCASGKSLKFLANQGAKVQEIKSQFTSEYSMNDYEAIWKDILEFKDKGIV